MLIFHDEFLVFQDLNSSNTKRRNSEADLLSDHPNHQWPNNTHTTGSSNDLNSYVIGDMTRDNASDYDLAAYQQQYQTKKSVSFSENIAKHLISPCNPTMTLLPTAEPEENELPPNNDLAMILHGKRDTPNKKVTARYGEMRRCQSKSFKKKKYPIYIMNFLFSFQADVIVVDRVHHMHSFSESPPNEFRLRETDSLVPEEEDDDDQDILAKAHVNIVEEPIQPPPAKEKSKPVVEKMTSSIDKENKVPEPSINMTVSTITLNPTNDPTLDGRKKFDCFQ